MPPLLLGWTILFVEGSDCTGGTIFGVSLLLNQLRGLRGILTICSVLCSEDYRILWDTRWSFYS